MAVAAFLVTVGVVVRNADEGLYDRVIDVFEASNCTAAGNGTFFLDIPDAEAVPLDLRHPEEELLGTLYCRLCNHSLLLIGDILQGAHVVVENDNGWYYDVFVRLKGAYPRTSSHQSILQQYGVPEGSTLETLLTGEHHAVEPGRPDSTWFQLEGSQWNPWHHPWASLIHIVNYLEYVFSQRNIGPLGDSPYTEWNPLVLPFRGT